MMSSNEFWKLIASFAEQKVKETSKNEEGCFPRNGVYEKGMTFQSKGINYEERRNPKAAFANRLTVEASCFDVKITTADVPDVEATLIGNISNPDNVEFTVDVIENELIVKVKIKSIFLNGDLSLDIVLPREQRFKEINIATSTGDVEVSEKVLVNTLKINTSSGEVDLTHIHALESMKIKTSTGDVNVHDDVESGMLQINTSSGEVTIGDDIKVGNIEVTTSTGDIYLSGDVVAEKIWIETSSGEVELYETKSSGYINIKTSTGDIETGRTKAKSFGIETSSGAVCLVAEFSNVDIKTTTGDVNVSASAKTDMKMLIVTGSGDVSIELDHVGKLTQAVKTSCGDIDCNYFGNGEYEADINVTTSTGDIEIS